MPLPPVVIELAPQDASSPDAAALVAACSDTVSDGDCRLGSRSNDPTRAVVIVSWDPNHRRAHVEIGVRKNHADQWAARDLDFKAGDPERERWRAVGLVIGTLVGEAEREQQQKPAETTPAPPPNNPPPTPETQEPKTSPSTSEQHARLWLGGEGFAGPALDDGSWRFGAGLIGIVDLPLPRVLVGGTFRYAIRPADDENVDARWITIAAGPGLHYEPTGVLRLEGRTEFLLERMDASVSGSVRDSGGRWLPGLRLSLAAGGQLGNSALLTGGVEATMLSKGTLVTLGSERIGRAPPLAATISVGLRFAPF